MIGADLLVLLVTWSRTYETLKMSGSDDEKDKQTFAMVLLRDGA